MARENPLTKLIIGFGHFWLSPQRARQTRLTIILISSQIITIIFFFTRLPPQIPLFFSRPWGIWQLTSPFTLLILPFFSLLVLLINLFIASLFVEENDFLSNVLTFGSLIFAIFSLIAIFKSIALAL